MIMNEYVTEKLRQLDEERLNQSFIATRVERHGNGQRLKDKRVIGPALRVAGRTLRRMGSGLEHWAEPPAPEAERRGLERRSW